MALGSLRQIFLFSRLKDRDRNLCLVSVVMWKNFGIAGLTGQCYRMFLDWVVVLQVCSHHEVVLFYQIFWGVHKIILKNYTPSILYFFENFNIFGRHLHLLAQYISEVFDGTFTVDWFRFITVWYFNFFPVDWDRFSTQIE